MIFCCVSNDSRDKRDWGRERQARVGDGEVPEAPLICLSGEAPRLLSAEQGVKGFDATKETRP